MFDYFYGLEAEEFSFYRIPKLLFTNSYFKTLSNDAKILYGLLLDRMSLSRKNNWLDEENRVYIIYTIDNIMEDLNCARATAVKSLSELDDKTGIGLIKKKRRGQGQPSIIYVMNFVTVSENVNKNVDKPVDNSRSSKIELQEVQNLNFKKSKNRTSKSSENRLPEVQKVDGNNTNNKYTENNDTESILQSTIEDGYVDCNYASEVEILSRPEVTSVEKENEYYRACFSFIKDNVNYDLLLHLDQAITERFEAGIVSIDEYESRLNLRLADRVIQYMADFICSKSHDDVKIGSDIISREIVKAKLETIDGLKFKNTVLLLQHGGIAIKNLKHYAISALYNS